MYFCPAYVCVYIALLSNYMDALCLHLAMPTGLLSRVHFADHVNSVEGSKLVVGT